MGEDLIFKGRIWVFGDNVDTDQILPGYAMSYSRAALKDHAMAGSPVADFAQRVQAGDIIVAGANFGCGSSREQAALALKDTGVALVVAASFARIFRRNAINIGLAVLQADVAEQVQTGDSISADVRSGRVWLPDGGVKDGQAPGSNVIAILAAGGLINKVRRDLATKGV